MTIETADIPIERDAVISTWFGVGGRADRLARPVSVDDIPGLVCDNNPTGNPAHGPIRILGDGANLLVDDDGVDGLVISLEECNKIERLDETTFRVDAGVSLPKLVADTVRLGLAGLEGLGGIPASVGGAVAMNAGGAWGQISDVAQSVRVVEMSGAVRTIDRADIDFGYRRSGLHDLVIVQAVIALTPGDPETLRNRLKEVMAHKKRTQPMADNSAGCAFKNPILNGERTSAGALIDKAGCKGLRQGSAHVSDKHANFILIDPGGRARDAIELIDIVAQRVLDSQGVTLEREVVIWKRGQ